ncbi:hypothetical protein NE865_06858 [Phthorimaea operculella]|nr:hypothetical protein NE865_06858 [Phthorimaea operculella]
MLVPLLELPEKKHETKLPVKKNETDLSEKKNETSPTNLTTTIHIRSLLMMLMTEVVKNSTAVPFRFPYNKYLCFYCFDDFVYSTDLVKHTKDEHNGQNLKHILMRNYSKSPSVKLDVNNLTCKRCNQPAKDLNEFVDHAKECHNFVINKEILKHVQCYKLSDEEMTCLQCEQKFHFFGRLLSHTNKFHNSMPQFLCETCGRGFPSQQRVDEHVKVAHTKDATYPCKKCKEVFPTYSKMKYHLDKTHKPYAMKCPHCFEAFDSRIKKNRHLAVVHNVKDLQHPCPDCGLVFDYRSHMVKHRSKVHLKELNATCDICGFKTFDNTSLKLHLVSHSAARPFECEFCKKAFQRKRNLELHERIHKNERRYELESPEKKYETKLPEKKNEPDLPEKKNETSSINSTNTIHIRSLLTMLMTEVVKNSTAVPFRFPNRKYMCFYCFDDFICSTDLVKHTKDEHDGQNLKHILMKNYSKNPSVKLDVNNLTCKRCNQPMKDFKEFIDHAKECHNFVINKEVLKHVQCYKLSDEEMSCLQCEQKFNFFGHLLSHTNKFHNNMPQFLCETCGTGFPSLQQVDKHVKMAHRMTYPCKKCKEVFPTHCKMLYHVDKIHRPNSMKCPQCFEAFDSRIKKKRHLAVVHNVKGLQHPCPDCGLVFDYRSHMLYHRSKIHLKELNATCGICGFKTFNNKSLNKHLISHSAARPFECEFCKKTFQRKRNLDIHERIHKNERRYVCQDCGKAFIQGTSLKVHTRTHHSSN